MISVKLELQLKIRQRGVAIIRAYCHIVTPRIELIGKVLNQVLVGFCYLVSSSLDALPLVRIFLSLALVLG